jgi:HK97 gp10 family phage protein
MVETVTIDGLKELERKLLEMSPKLAQKGLRSAVAAGARVITKEARIRVPVDTGTLKRAIYAKRIREASGPSQQTFYVGVRSGKREQKKNRDGFYFPMVEFGTSKMQARPFMRPAFEARKIEAATAIKTKLLTTIDTLAKQK